MLTFAAPLVLGALAALPVIYYLLRVMPPPAKRLFFPPSELFLKDDEQNRTPVHTPWWILLLRLLLLAALILAMAGPVWRQSAGSGAGPLLVVVDDSWPAAPNWAARVEVARQALVQAEEKGRLAALALLSQGGREVSFGAAGQALARLEAAKPQPLSFERLPLLEALRKPAADSDVLWISDGLAAGNAREFADGLAKLGNLKVFVDEKPVFGLAGFDGATVTVLSSAASPATANLRVLDEKSRVLITKPVNLNQISQVLALELPLELRNDIARLELENIASAGSVFLADDSNKRAKVGLYAEVNADLAQQNLLNSAYYLKKALSGFAEIVEPKPGSADPILNLLEAEPGVLVLADVAGFSNETSAKLRSFVAKGGLLVRFAGSQLARKADAFLPVTLRQGGRALGGALSWDVPKQIAPFDDKSLFAGLTVPKDVNITAQVLAVPDATLNQKVWATLTDGTPLVTFERREKGTIVLFHVTADTGWSNLALSGLFVEMLQKTIVLGPRVAGAQSAGASLSPLKSLDGFGVLGAASPDAESLPRGAALTPDAKHPPGLYGDAGQSVALNVLNAKSALVPVDLSVLAVSVIGAQARVVDFRPFLLILAVLLFLLDTAVMFFAGKTRLGAVALVVLAVLMPDMRPAQAQTLSSKDIEATLSVHLAYFITGDAQVDEISRSGLQNLSNVLARRTSVVPGDPVGLDPAKDNLDLYPLIYWPVSVKAVQPSAAAMARVGAFMKQGGTLVVDTRDALSQRPSGSTPEQLWLQSAMRGLNVPDLEPVPKDHVVTKTFYLIEGFYGRTMNGRSYIEALPPADGEFRPARASDSVSPIIITSNDLAAGWAADDSGRALFPLIPGGPRQREMSLRGGVNLVMYTLTGNYKADQVHMPALLERLGH